MWVKKHEPEVWKRTERIMFAKDFVRHMLTGDYVTDYIEAEGSMFFDYNRLSGRTSCSVCSNSPKPVCPK